MEPWIQPTTAPHQPDPTDEGQSLDDEEALRGERRARVERGWMETHRFAATTTPGGDSIAITVMTAAVVVMFLLLMIFAFPFLLLANW